ncbi:hypothetical protein ACQ4PT_065336 [Festuca glaucescens]
MARTTTEPLLLLPHQQQRQPPRTNRAWGAAVAVVLVLLLSLLLLRPSRPFGAPPPPRVELTLLAGATEGADFYNWNRVYVRYCDGASFSGDAEYQAQDGSTLHFRGLRIYEAVIDELMEKGLTNATQALLTGCSAGGLAAILHCDDFSARFPQEVSVKCLIDAGLFLDE